MVAFEPNPQQTVTRLLAWLRRQDPLRCWLAVWAMLAVLVVVTKWHGEPHHVTGIYRTASLQWFAGEPIWDGTGNGFVYLPQSSILFAPFTFLPGNVGNALWRVVNLAIFAWGIWRLVGLLRPQARADFYVLVAVVAGLLSRSAAGYGQMTLVMAGCMLLGIVELAEGRPWRSAACLVLSLLFKPISLPLLLLAGVLYRPLRLPLATTLAASLAIPFLTQHPAYVVEQYTALAQLGQDLGKHTATRAWSEVFHMLSVFGIDMPRASHLPLRLLGALFVLTISWRATRLRPASESGWLLFILASCYILLFSPRTENNTYALISPVVALGLALAVFEFRSKQAMLFATLFALLLLNATLSPLVTPQSSFWIKPLACTVLAAFASVQCLRHAAEADSNAVVDDLGGAAVLPMRAFAGDSTSAKRQFPIVNPNQQLNPTVITMSATAKSWTRRALRIISGLLPTGLPLPIVRGPLAGKWWIVGAASGPGKGLSTLTGDCEPEQVRKALALVNRDSICLDIGANVGFYTLLFSQTAKRVYAFEPLPRNLRHLIRHITLNKLANAHILPCAVSKAAEVSSFAVGSVASMGKLDAQGEIPVVTISCDQFVTATGVVPDVLKIDVEGAELAVLKGAQRLLTQTGPAILLSTHSDQLREDCLAFLRHCGYDAVEPIDASWEDEATEFVVQRPSATLRKAA